MGVTIALIGSGVALGAAPAMAAASDIPDGHQVVHYTFDDATPGCGRRRQFRQRPDGDPGERLHRPVRRGAGRRPGARPARRRTHLRRRVRPPAPRSAQAPHRPDGLGPREVERRQVVLAADLRPGHRHHQVPVHHPANGDGLLRTAITTGGGGRGGAGHRLGRAARGRWRTVTVTLDTTAHRLTTYLDGVAVSSAATAIKAKDLLDGSATAAGYIGKSFYPDPLLTGAIDDFTRLALGAHPPSRWPALPADLPTRPALVDRRPSTSVPRPGRRPSLPAPCPRHFSDGYDRDTAGHLGRRRPGEVRPAAARSRWPGTAAGRAVQATVTVVREGELTVDLGTDTGAFHGGASGTLYGVYGDGRAHQQPHRGHGPAHGLHQGAGRPAAPRRRRAGGGQAARRLHRRRRVHLHDRHPPRLPVRVAGRHPRGEARRLYKEKIAKQVDQVLDAAGRVPGQHRLRAVQRARGQHVRHRRVELQRRQLAQRPDGLLRRLGRASTSSSRARLPDARIAGPNTSILYDQVKGFLQHTVAADTVPDVITWHELSDPAAVRTSVAKYRAWENEVFAGTAFEGTRCRSTSTSTRSTTTPRCPAR